MSGSASPPAGTATAVPQPADAQLQDEATNAAEHRNFLMLVWYHITLRMAWIFKTESVIMPAFLDAIAGAGWIRGFLPWLNRIGQSLPPLLYADRLRRSRLKGRVLFCMTIAMAAPFLILCGLLLLSGSVAGTEDLLSFVPASTRLALKTSLPILFLVLYTIFFSLTGLSQLAFGTVQGKLIPANRRGGIILLSGVIGSAGAVTGAWLVLRSWLSRPDGGFFFIFLTTATGFLASAIWILFLKEAPDENRPKRAGRARHIREATSLLRSDMRFRRIVIVGTCFVSSLFLFPHYQALGREQSGFALTDLLGWVIAQNLGAGLASVVAGPIADRLGNRLTLRCLTFACSVPPIFAIILSMAFPTSANAWYWVTFLMLGCVPITFRTLTNYTLELAAEEDHPRYLSTLKICIAVPFCFSPLVGAMVEWAGFVPVFLAVSGIVLFGACYTFRIEEPRFDTAV